MVLITILWVFTSIGCLQTWEVSNTEEYNLVETWGIHEVQDKFAGREVIKKKFKQDEDLTCDSVYKTEETPFVAIVLYRTSGRLLCMGSIVDNLHILTAKRCYEKTDPQDLKVLTGCYKAYWAKNSQVSNVRRIIRHEYEIAMLRLVDPLKYTKYVQAVRLPPTFTAMITEFIKVFGGPYKVAGFNVDRFDVPGDYVGKDKSYKFVEDKLIELGQCQSNFSKYTIEKTKVFCTFGNATFCWGGLGGPILKWLKGKLAFVQVGIVVADNCTSQDTGPYLAARTDSFAAWIQGNAFQGHQPL